MKFKRLSLLSSALLLLLAAGCGKDPEPSAEGTSCTVEDQGDGTALISCPDGTEFTVKNGVDGKDGEDGADGAPGVDGKDGEGAESPCELSANDDGTQSLVCGEQSIVLGASCEDGFPGSLVLVDPEKYTDSTSLLLFQVSNCTKVNGDLWVVENPSPAYLDTLTRIEAVGGNVTIADNDNIESLRFESLRSVGGMLVVEDDLGLQEIAFPALETVGISVYFDETLSLESVDLSSLKEVGEFVTFDYNESLESIELPSLERAKKGFSFFDNNNLKTVQAPKLAEAELLYFINNPALTTISDFPQLTEIPVGFGVMGSSSLTKTPAFPELQSAGGFGAIDNENLEEFGALPKLTKLTANLEISENEKLTNLDAFENLETIGGDLTISENEQLTSIEGLTGLSKIERDFIITENPALSQCDVEDLIDSIQAQEGIGRNIIINDNAACSP